MKQKVRQLSRTEVDDGPALPNKGFGQRIYEARVKRGLTQLALGKLLGSDSHSRVAQWERFKNIPSSDTIKQVADILGVSPQWLAFGITDEPKVVAPNPAQLGYVLVPEVRFGDTIDDLHEVQQWGVPFNYLRNEMQITSTDNLIMIQVETPCEPFGFGDRVLVDRTNAKPSPAGHFLVWDGLGANLVHLSLVPNAKRLTVRVKTDNDTYEVSADKINIIGRVKLWKKA